jgi:hypothetical protein
MQLTSESIDPYMADVTPLPRSVTPAYTTNGKFMTSMEEKHEFEDQCVIFESAYAWIPSVIQISPKGNHAVIDSYINGLGTREQFPILFRLIEQVFELALPLLEKTISFDVLRGIENSACKSIRSSHRRKSLTIPQMNDGIEDEASSNQLAIPSIMRRGTA